MVELYVGNAIMKLKRNHIDYDKLNCNPDNLISLCNSCHSKTNYNRNYWINYFERSFNPIEQEIYEQRD